METESRPRLFYRLTDRELLRLLCREEDRLPRTVVDEFVRRGDRMIEPLTDACRSEAAWRQDGPLFWTAVHATLILGAMRSPRALDGLLASLRWSTRHDVDWAYEALPAIFGALGRPAMAVLESRLLDLDASGLERAMAAHGLGGVAARHPIEQGEVLDFLRGVLRNADETESVRRAAGQVLLAFIRPGDRAPLEEAGLFPAGEVRAAYGRGGQALAPYLADWLEFYGEGEIGTRLRRRGSRDEDARWSKGAQAAEPWVEQEMGLLLRKYEWMLTDLADDERGEALWVADSMMEYAVRHEGRAPWRWDDAAAFSYLMDSFARRVSMDDPGNIVAVPDNVLRFVRFCANEGLLTEEERRAVEACIHAEREGFLEAALDPELRREARAVIEGLLARGIDPSDAEALDGVPPRP